MEISGSVTRTLTSTAASPGTFFNSSRRSTRFIQVQFFPHAFDPVFLEEIPHVIVWIRHAFFRVEMRAIRERAPLSSFGELAGLGEHQHLLPAGIERVPVGREYREVCLVRNDIDGQSKVVHAMATLGIGDDLSWFGAALGIEGFLLVPGAQTLGNANLDAIRCALFGKFSYAIGEDWMNFGQPRFGDVIQWTPALDTRRAGVYGYSYELRSTCHIPSQPVLFRLRIPLCCSGWPMRLTVLLLFIAFLLLPLFFIVAQAHLQRAADWVVERLADLLGRLVIGPRREDERRPGLKPQRFDP